MFINDYHYDNCLCQLIYIQLVYLVTFSNLFLCEKKLFFHWQLDINTVAAGGGSRLFFRAGLFVVGPESAGAHPGPVCYRKGKEISKVIIIL